MAELLAQEQQSRPKVMLYTLAIFFVIAGGVYMYARFQSSNRPPGVELPVVPGMARPGEPNFEYYKNYVRISEVKATLGINFAKSRIAIVSGIITNEGDRKLEALELHIALYDVYNKLSKERTSTPLRPDVGVKRPMDPLEKREFTVWIEPIEQLWNPKRLEIEISGLKYQ
jgi:hypothetical protein